MIQKRAGCLRGALLTLLTGACLLGTVPARTAAASGPISLSGSLGDAPYTIRVPARWNGTLILYSHGYVIPGQPNPAPEVADTPTGEWLLAHGYALAASAYSGTGWAVREGERDGMALLAYFAAHVRRPARVIAWGHSLGGLITADLVQRYPGSFAGALPMCGVVGGSVGAWNLQLDAAFAFKTLLAPRLPLAVVGIRSPLLNLVTAGRALTAAQRTAAGRARLSLVAALSGVPGWYDPSAPAPTDLAARERAQYRWLSTIDLPFFFALRADIEARAGGNPSWNTGVDYAGAAGRIQPAGGGAHPLPAGRAEPGRGSGCIAGCAADRGGPEGGALPAPLHDLRWELGVAGADPAHHGRWIGADER